MAHLDRAELAASILLDLSPAFDTVDHDILLQRGINDITLQWFQSYQLGRSQYVRRGDAKSTDCHRAHVRRAAGFSIRTNTVHHVHCRPDLGH